MSQLDDADNEITNSSMRISGPVKISAPSTFGRLHVLPLIPDLLALYPDLALDLLLSDIVRDMVEDRVELAVRVGPVDEPDAVVRCIAGMPMVCVGSGKYFRERGMPQVPADVVDHNCLVYGGLREADWLFVGPNGPFSVSVRGNLSSNSIETIQAGVLAGVGIGFFTKASLAEELPGPSVVAILDEFVQDAKDVTLVWPNRRFVPARVRRATEFSRRRSRSACERITGSKPNDVYSTRRPACAVILPSMPQRTRAGKSAKQPLPIVPVPA